MNRKLIAIIYEGEKTEEQLIKNLNTCFFHDFTELLPVSFPAGENIYMLWNQLKNDEFQTDIIEVLREYNSIAKERLKDYTRNDFMETYLFFDYDGHTNNSKHKGCNPIAIEEMLQTFSDETDFGKLYINYPMVESIRDNRKTETCYRHCSLPIESIGDYKGIVHRLTVEDDCMKYQDIRKYGKEDWKVFCLNSIRKLNCITYAKYSVPDRKSFLNTMGQTVLYQMQKEKFIEFGRVAIINSFPLFLLEYFKEDFWQEYLCSGI